jgi:NAD(P)-dependent dehydrogenase (short-subunit alcohol dehydrogenase family)
MILVSVLMNNYPDLSGRKILITGATDGIGKELSLMFAHTGAGLILHGRNPERLATTLKEITEETGNPDSQTVIADFTSLTQVKAMAEEIKQEVAHIDILVNNAGLYPKYKVITEDGFEQTLQVNYISPVTLTLALLPILGGKKPSRIVNLTSIGHRFVWSNIRDPQARFFWGWVSYCRSKLLMIPFTRELASRLSSSNVTVNCVHPGIIRTKLIRVLPVSWGVSVHHGAMTVFNLATNPKFDGVTGKYLEEFRIVKPSPVASSLRLQETLWRISLRWAGLTTPKATITPEWIANRSDQ